MTIVDAPRPVTGGVDTHLDLNVAAALDAIGGLLAVAEFPATSGGHRRLLGWLAGFGPVARVGVEGTGSYGAGLARHLRAAGVEVVEVDRPNRQARRRAGKSDPLDAIEAARAALSGRACGAAKTRDGNVEAIRALVVAKRSAPSAKIKSLNQIRHLSYTAPEQLRQRLKDVSRQQLAAQAASDRSRPGLSPAVTSKVAAVSIPTPCKVSRSGAVWVTSVVSRASMRAFSSFRASTRRPRIRSAVLVAARTGSAPSRQLGRSAAAWAASCWRETSLRRCRSCSGAV